MPKKTKSGAEKSADLDRERAAKAKSILAEIAKHKNAAKKGDNFVALTEEEIIRKLNRVNSPFITFQAWSGNAPPGGTINYTVGITNPDPVSWSNLYAHVFIGPANPVPDVGTALLNVDPRFPRLTMPSFFGLTLAANSQSSLAFSVKVPASIEPSNYLGNTFLFAANYHDLGTHLDRAVFPFRVP